MYQEAMLSGLKYTMYNFVLSNLSLYWYQVVIVKKILVNEFAQIKENL